MAKSLYDTQRVSNTSNQPVMNVNHDNNSERDEAPQFTNEQQENTLSKMEAKADIEQSTLLEQKTMLENLEKSEEEQSLEKDGITKDVPEDELSERMKALTKEGKDIDKKLYDIEHDRFGREGHDIDSEYADSASENEFSDYSKKGRHQMAEQAAFDAQDIEQQGDEANTSVKEYTIQESSRLVYHDDEYSKVKADYDRQFSNEYDVNGDRVYGNGAVSDLTNTIINEADYEAGKPKQFDDVYETTRTVNEKSASTPDSMQASLDISDSSHGGSSQSGPDKEQSVNRTDLSSNKAVADLMAKYQADSEAYQERQESAPQPEDFMPKSRYI